MKYLKIYEEYSNDIIDQEILDELDDILLDLKDDGYEFRINPHGMSHLSPKPIPSIISKIYPYSYNLFSIIIKKYSKFEMSDINECVIRASNFLMKRGFEQLSNYNPLVRESETYDTHVKYWYCAIEYKYIDL